MNTQSQNSITQKLTEVIDWLTQKRWSTASPQTTDDLYPEIKQLEKALSNAPTRPTRIVRNKVELLEPVTEQQKILDMAG
ncbi:MAG: hypothetical protein JW953_22810 [Anaerolineae bacterium]|nr:hypothetical protein [Anaerolineae bacterium]